MLTWKDQLVEQQRREDQRAQAAWQRSLRALALYPANDTLTRRSLHAFGRRLVAWGCSLQTRYPLKAQTANRTGTTSLALPAPRRALDK